VRRPPPPALETAEHARWCAAGLEAVAGNGCFAAPRAEARPPFPLLVYLHGRYADEGAEQERERQARVARMATARGYAVLALQGRKGECTDPQLTEWWCWPSNERNAADGAAFVAAWAPAIAEARGRGATGRRVLLGFSNGGYFASLIASRALAPFDAVAIAHAGPVSPMTPEGPRPPVLLLTADQDPSDAEIARLAADLTRERWPFVQVDREGGHDLPEWDVQMALTFFDRTAREPLPLAPPLAPPRVRTIATAPEPDASTPPPIPEATAAPTTEPTPAAPAIAPTPVTPIAPTPAPLAPTLAPTADPAPASSPSAPTPPAAPTAPTAPTAPEE